MSKLSKEELLDEFINAYGHHPSSIKNEQAYQQIKEMIQKPEVTEEFIKKWAEIMCNFRSAPKVFEDYKLPVKTMLKEAGYEAVKSVTEEWIEEKVKNLYEESKAGSCSVKSFCNFFIRKLVEEIK